VAFEKLAPVPIAYPRGCIRGAHDVGEQDGGEDAIVPGRRTRSRQEPLDLVGDRVDVA
jgi:hypothetical protein